MTARRLRPIRRWISWVRPLWRPLETSRGVRVSVERGSMLYSLEIHPLPRVAHELRDGFFDRRGADDARVADFNQNGAFGGGDEIGREEYGAELVGGTIIRAIEHERIVNERGAVNCEPRAISYEF